MKAWVYKGLTEMMTIDFNYLKRFTWGQQKSTGAEEMGRLALNKGQNIRDCPVTKNMIHVSSFSIFTCSNNR